MYPFILFFKHLLLFYPITMCNTVSVFKFWWSNIFLGFWYHGNSSVKKFGHVIVLKWSRDPNVILMLLCNYFTYEYILAMHVFTSRQRLISLSSGDLDPRWGMKFEWFLWKHCDSDNSASNLSESIQIYRAWKS